MESVLDDPILEKLEENNSGEVSAVEHVYTQYVAANSSIVFEKKTKFEDIDLEGLEEDMAEFHKDEIVEAALNKGVDLKKYYVDLERNLKVAEADCVSQYVDNSDKVADLHRNIQTCDGTLSRIEEMLLRFQGDLGGISEEIKHLQNESVSMNVRLKNRKAVEELLKYFIENAVLSPDDADAINHKPINEQFLQAVLSLNEKLQFLTRTAVGVGGKDLGVAPCETMAGKELIPEMMTLKTRAIARTKEFFIANIAEMKKGKTNINMIQQNSLVKYAKLFKILLREAPQMGEEVRGSYVDIMQKLVTNLFKNYYAALLKMEIIVATKADVLVIADAPMKSLFTQKIDFSFNKDKSSAGGETFALNGRDEIISDMESSPILVHVATAEKARYHFEVLFRSLLKHLVDAASNEFLFLLDFFQTEVHDTFYKIYGRGLSLILENLEDYMLSCYDVVSLLLCIRITQSMRLVMQRRRIPTLDSFFDRVTNMLWPRFDFVLGLNLKSLKQANPKEFGPVDLAPQYVCRRYAELICVLTSLDGGALKSSMGSRVSSMDGMNGSLHSNVSQGTTNDKVGGSAEGKNVMERNMQALRTEMIDLLARLAHTHIVSSKDQRVFYINNYDMILTTLQSRKINSAEVGEYESLLAAQKEMFAEEEVGGAFPRLVTFVTQTEQLMNGRGGKERDRADGKSAGGASGDTLNLDEAIVESLVRDFAANWRGGIKQINDGVLSHFANFRNGTEILKQVLTQLLLYYTRFQDIIKRAWSSKPPPFSREIVTTATIMLEIKKYNRSF